MLTALWSVALCANATDLGGVIDGGAYAAHVAQAKAASSQTEQSVIKDTREYVPYVEVVTSGTQAVVRTPHAGEHPIGIIVIGGELLSRNGSVCTRQVFRRLSDEHSRDDLVTAVQLPERKFKCLPDGTPL